TKVNPGTPDVREFGPARTNISSDERQVPYFLAADATKPVVLAPVAHYSARNATTTTGYGRTGWYAKTATVATPCTSTCTQLHMYPPDTSAAYVEQQKLMPAVTGTTSFTPSGAFGLWNGDFSSVNYVDDAKNYAINASGATIAPPHYLHSFRVYQAYGPGRVLIPNTWIVGTDITRTPSFKNNDFQDVVWVLRNAKPELGFAPVPGSNIESPLSLNLSVGGTVSPTCQVTGFDGVLPNSSATQCNAANMQFGAGGLQMTSTAGQLANRNQQNALYKNFDASRGAFTVTARVLGPIDYLNNDYQQVAAWFGPDDRNFVKVEAEHNGANSPHMTMFFAENGVGTTVAMASVPALTSCTTLDLVIQGNTNVPDPTPAASDPNKVRNYPLGEVKVSYRINGGAPVAIGTVRRPADVMRWFSTMAQAGILVSGGNSTVPFTSTFSNFSVTAG
ncbi:MAG: hypothetical protein ABIM89_11265, partial [Mycobacteriales bacterium]